jgi:hypothetical protein
LRSPIRRGCRSSSVSSTASNETASPAEIIDDRLEGQADGEARSAANEQHEESGGEGERGARDDLVSRQGTNFTWAGAGNPSRRVFVALLAKKECVRSAV